MAALWEGAVPTWPPPLVSRGFLLQAHLAPTNRAGFGFHQPFNSSGRLSYHDFPIRCRKRGISDPQSLLTSITKRTTLDLWIIALLQVSSTTRVPTEFPNSGIHSDALAVVGPVDLKTSAA